jgi:hypothetical protein
MEPPQAVTWVWGTLSTEGMKIVRRVGLMGTPVHRTCRLEDGDLVQNRGARSLHTAHQVAKNTVVFSLYSWGGMILSPFGTSATNWPIVPAPDDRRWWMWSSRWNENWHGKRKYSENVSQCHFVHHKFNMTWPGLEPGPPQWEGGD